jgi:uncharacterized protein YlxW (UPF0749 family)
LIVSTQTKVYIDAENSKIPESRQLNQLVVLLKDSQNKKIDLEKQLIKIRQQFNDISKGKLPESLADNQLQKLYQISGLTSVAGKGIIIKLDDRNNISKASANNDALVQSDDILKIINELKASGAKAISVNNLRLVTTSEVVTAGSNIMINQTRLVPPYIIKAVGPTDTMIASLKMRGGIVEYLEVFGIKVTIKEKPDITVSPFTGSLS